MTPELETQTHFIGMIFFLFAYYLAGFASILVFGDDDSLWLPPAGITLILWPAIWMLWVIIGVADVAMKLRKWIKSKLKP